MRNGFILAIPLCFGLGAGAALAAPDPRDEAVAAASEDAPVTDLRAALLAAYRHNPRLEAERANSRAADERYGQALAAFGPTVSLEGRYDYAQDRIGRTAGGDFRGSGYATTARAVLDQPLFTSGRLSAGRASARAQVDFGRQSLRGIETQVLQSTIEAYVNVLLARELVGIARSNRAALERQQNEGRARYKVREITLTDFEQIVSQAELARARVETSTGAEDAALAEFARVIGVRPAALDPLPPLGMIPATLEDALALADLDSPVLLAARARERSSYAETARARAATLPTVSLEAQRERAPVTPYFDTPSQTQTRAGVVVRMPLFTSGALSARVREAREANSADAHLADQALRDARAETATRWARMEAARAAVARLEQSMVAAQGAFDHAQIQQRAGDRSTQDVLNLARDLLNAQANLATTRADAYIAQTGLLAAVGRLELADLVPAEPIYDPQQHLRSAVGKVPGAAVAATLGQIDGVLAPTSKRQPLPGGGR